MFYFIDVGPGEADGVNSHIVNIAKVNKFRVLSEVYAFVYLLS